MSRRTLGLLALVFLAGLGAREVASQVSVAASRVILPYLRVTGGSAALTSEGIFLPAAGRLGFVTGGTQQWEIDQSGDLVTTADNTENIGNVAGLRPANVYVGTAVAVGDSTASAGTFRMPNTGSLQARDAANSANLSVLSTDAANTVIVASGSALTISTVPNTAPTANTGWKFVCVSTANGKILFGTSVGTPTGCN